MSLQLFAGPTSSEEHQAKTNVDFWIYVGVAVIFLIFGVFGVWAALAHLTSAALAPGVIAVDSNWRTIQHLEGGIVAEILVREGDFVQEGDVLLRLDPTRSDASLSILDSQLVLAKATEARLIAERDGADLIDFPEELIDRMEDQEVATVVAGQDLLFRARRDSMEGQINILNERVEQLSQQIEGLQVQQDARANQTALIEKELEGLQQLFDEGYASQQRILALQRDAERLRGERGENLASIASARSQIGETELQILQLDKNFREEVVNELRTVQSQVFDLQERRTAAADERRRIDIVAPVNGQVLGLSAFTVGGVIKSGADILNIVPENDQLVIQARVSPDDHERVSVGQSAQVRLTGLSRRSTPVLLGEVVTISGDRLTDRQSGEAYYEARIIIPEEQLGLLEDTAELVPGMPAEVMIETGARSALGYILSPLTDSLDRAFKE